MEGGRDLPGLRKRKQIGFYHIFGVSRPMEDLYVTKETLEGTYA